MDLNNYKIIPKPETIRLLDISDEEYFGKNYRKYISNSKLSLINPHQEGSAEKFFRGFESLFSDSLYFGSAVHEMTLQPEEFYVQVCNRPTAKAGFMLDEIIYNRTKGQSIYDSIINASNKVDYYKGKMDSKKIRTIIQKGLKYYLERLHYTEGDKIPIWLNTKDNIKLNECLGSISRNENITRLLNPDVFDQSSLLNLNEGTLVMDVDVVDLETSQVLTLPLKAKLDNFTYDSDFQILTLNDLKTTGKYTTEFSKSFEKYHYHRQMAMYIWMLKMYIQKEYNVSNPSLRANMLVVSTVPNYSSLAVSVNTTQIQQGFQEFAALVKLVAHYIVHEGYEL